MGYLTSPVLFFRSEAVKNSLGILRASLYSKNFIVARSFYVEIVMDLSL